MALEEICLHKFLGHCLGCSKDYNDEHHPNNYDCIKYSPMHIGTFIVKEAIKNDLDREIQAKKI